MSVTRLQGSARTPEKLFSCELMCMDVGEEECPEKGWMRRQELSSSAAGDLGRLGRRRLAPDTNHSHGRPPNLTSYAS